MRRLSSSILASGILLTFASSLKADTTVEAGTKTYYSDQVPISSDKQIELTIDDNGGATHNEENGQLKWILNLAPGESREITYRFTVKYPKNKIIGNL